MKKSKILNKTKKKTTKAELANFFTVFEIEFNKIKKYYYSSLLVFISLCFRALLDYNLYLSSFIFGLVVVLVISHVTFYHKFSMTWKNFYKKDIKEFISFISVKGKKRTASSKFIIERLEKAQIHDKRFISFDFFSKGFYILFSLFFLSFLPYELILYYFFNFPSLVLTQFPLFMIFGMVFSYLFVVIFQIRYVDYNNVNETKKIFKHYINIELSEIDENIENFIQKPNDQIKHNLESQTLFLMRWYDMYCSRFFDNKEFNDIICQFVELIFDDAENEFYHELFLTLKIRVIDYLNFESNSNNNSNNINAEKLLKVVQNYIDLLEFNIKVSKEIKRKRIEKLSTWQKWIYLTVVPISFIINLIISFIF